MRNTMIAIAATACLLALGAIAASAAPMHGFAPVQVLDHQAVQHAGWYCGPRGQYWRHRRWDEHRHWREYRYGYNGRHGYDYR